MRVVALVLLLWAGLARAGCLEGVDPGPVMPRTGLQKMVYRECHFENGYNANIDLFEAALSSAPAILVGVNATSYDNFPILFADGALTLHSVGCYCWGTTTTKPDFTFADTTGDAIGLDNAVTYPTCETGTSTVTFYAFDPDDADGDIVAGGRVEVLIANSPTEPQNCAVLLRY